MSVLYDCIPEMAVWIFIQVKRSWLNLFTSFSTLRWSPE